MNGLSEMLAASGVDIAELMTLLTGEDGTGGLKADTETLMTEVLGSDGEGKTDGLKFEVLGKFGTGKGSGLKFEVLGNNGKGGIRRNATRNGNMIMNLKRVVLGPDGDAGLRAQTASICSKVCNTLFVL